MSETDRPTSEPVRGPDSASDQPKDNIDDKPTVPFVDKRRWSPGKSNAATQEGEDTKSAHPSYVDELERRVADLERKLADRDVLLTEYAQKYKDAMRDFDQTRERLTRALAQDVERETRSVLSSFLEVVDNLDRALASTAHEAEDVDSTAVLEGVQLVRDQFLATIGRYGVKRIDADGQVFDPNLHDALSTVPVTDTSQDNVVLTVVKPGYVVNDDVLRHATVTVGKLTAGK